VKHELLQNLGPSPPVPGQSLELLPLSLPSDGNLALVREALAPLLQEEEGKPLVAVFLCVGHEKQEEATISFMVNSALATLRQCGREVCVVLTSSTGSTNLPGADPSWAKTESEAWSDPLKQQEQGKYSPAAKTLMELQSLAEVGRDRNNAVVDREKADRAPRLCIINPSLILAPALKPGGTGQALPWFGRIVKGEAMGAEVPNNSMSIIHCEDLAKLHVACLLNKEASGRYFGVVKSWPWKDILQTIKKIRGEKYKMPPVNFSESEAVPPTQFDFSRRNSLLVGAFGEKGATEHLRGLEDILGDTISWMEEKQLV